jgi:UDP-3-O-[3-hydroxymyristoyl] glucosamine N-acyltransferase
VDDPRAAFVQVVGRFHPPARPEPGVHATAIIGTDVQIGEGVSIGPYTVVGAGTRIGDGALVGAGCHIGPGVEIGANTLLHDAVTVYGGTKIGRNCILHSGCVLGADGFGFVLAGDHYEKFPQIGRVELGDDVEIGANTCVDRAALGVTRIGDGTKLDNLIQVGHNVTIGNHVVIAAGTGISGGATIGNYVVIAGQVGLGEKANIEDKAILGGQCGVLPSKTVPGGEAVWGTPARPLRQHLAQLANLGKVADLRRQIADLQARLEKIEEAE